MYSIFITFLFINCIFIAALNWVRLSESSNFKIFNIELDPAGRLEIGT